MFVIQFLVYRHCSALDNTTIVYINLCELRFIIYNCIVVFFCWHSVDTPAVQPIDIFFYSSVESISKRKNEFCLPAWIVRSLVLLTQRLTSI